MYFFFFEPFSKYSTITLIQPVQISILNTIKKILIISHRLNRFNYCNLFLKTKIKNKLLNYLNSTISAVTMQVTV